MRFGLLAASLNWHGEDLLRAARDRGVEMELVDFGALQALEQGNVELKTIPSSKPSLRGRGIIPVPLPRREGLGEGFGNVANSEKRVHSFDAFIIRMMPLGTLEQVIFRMDVLHAAMNRGVVVLNPPRALETCIDKFLTTHRLALAGLPTPRTWAGQRTSDAVTAFEQLGGDVVVKPLFGSEGKGVERLTSIHAAAQAFSTIESAGNVIYIQEFVQHPGWDLRVFVLHDRVLASMRRYALDGWRTNIALGGRGEAATLSHDEEKLALDAARAVGSPLAGVDLLPGPNGYQVIEINAVPGWKGLAAATGVDVAGAVVEFVAGLVE